MTGEMLGGFLSAGQFPGPVKDALEHLGCELPGEGVLLAGMVATKEMDTIQDDVPAMGKRRTRAWQSMTRRSEGTKRPIPGKGTERDDDLQPIQELDLPGKVREAVVPLLGSRLVGRRGAAIDRRDVQVPEP